MIRWALVGTVGSATTELTPAKLLPLALMTSMGTRANFSSGKYVGRSLINRWTHVEHPRTFTPPFSAFVTDHCVSLPQHTFLGAVTSLVDITLNVPHQGYFIIYSVVRRMFSYLCPVPALPEYPGPLAVGSTEYEIPVSEIPSPSPVPDSTISSLKFRIFYPTSSPASSKQTIYWLPQPQRQWLEAYATFVGASPRLAKLFSYPPNPLKYTVFPAVPDAELLPLPSGDKYPVAIFSHGLGGSCNAYSSILGALASCGVICVASEHRDQSCPVSIIRHGDGTTTIVPYLTLPHNAAPETIKGRNAQLRIRLWELELLYTVVEKLDLGSVLANLAHESMPSFKNMLDLSPSNVTWVGHSFGAASLVQLFKSVFWQSPIPDLQGTDYENDADWRPLYTPAQNSALSMQITAQSPLVLLDLWTMPLFGAPSTAWLWEKPLPCWAAKREAGKSNVVAIMSEAFYKWPELLRQTKSLLSKQPAEDSTRTAGVPGQPPRLFYTPKTAHLSQSDFGCLFPWVMKRFLSAENPERTILLNVRAILQLFRERGVYVESFKKNVRVGEKDEMAFDKEILAADARVEGWIPVSLDD